MGTDRDTTGEQSFEEQFAELHMGPPLLKHTRRGLRDAAERAQNNDVDICPRREKRKNSDCGRELPG